MATVGVKGLIVFLRLHLLLDNLYFVVNGLSPVQSKQTMPFLKRSASDLAF